MATEGSTPIKEDRTRRGDGEADWLQCGGCGCLLYRKRFERHGRLCSECGWHSVLTPEQRIESLLDEGSVKPVEIRATVEDPIGFEDVVTYDERLATARARSGRDDAVVVAFGALKGNSVVVAAMDFGFLGGSLGVAAGEAITTAAETALAERVPLLLVTASGGARMQEGAMSLMQMAKTSNAMAQLDEAGLLTVTLVTDPTFGGVAASYATLSDVVLAEPGARMGFAGPRVIEQTIRAELPEGFQSAESLLRRGLVDDVRPRSELRSVLDMLFRASRAAGHEWGEGSEDPVWYHEEQVPQRPLKEVLAAARDVQRPTTLDYLANWSDGFAELHGDRNGADCAAIVGGIAVMDGIAVMVIGHQKGHSTPELVARNFGMATPSGYCKVARLVRLASKLGVPVLTLIDTPGAYPGAEAEERGQAHAISDCLRTLGSAEVPIVSVVTGEGGSGGALALGVADRVYMCANATYSVISPEGCAAILWKSPDATEAAAEALQVDAPSLLGLGIVDGVVPEPEGGAQADPAGACALLRSAVVAALRDLRRRAGADLVAERRRKFRRFGTVEEVLG